MNYGVASLARALGTPRDELLALRCECGDALCAGIVWISVAGYELTRVGPALLVAPGHEAAAATGS